MPKTIQLREFGRVHRLNRYFLGREPESGEEITVSEALALIKYIYSKWFIKAKSRRGCCCGVPIIYRHIYPMDKVVAIDCTGGIHKCVTNNEQ